MAETPSQTPNHSNFRLPPFPSSTSLCTRDPFSSSCEGLITNDTMYRVTLASFSLRTTVSMVDMRVRYISEYLRGCPLSPSLHPSLYEGPLVSSTCEGRNTSDTIEIDVRVGYLFENCRGFEGASYFECCMVLLYSIV